MPLTTFQTCLVVTALAAGQCHGQSYLHLEQEPVDNRALRRGTIFEPRLHDEEYRLEHEVHHELDHSYDGEAMRYVDRDVETMAHRHPHFREVHHPHEDVDFGSHEDMHRHYHPADDRYHPREAADSY